MKAGQNDILRKTIGENLKATRVHLKFSLDNVASVVGFSKSKLSEWENAQKPIPLGALYTLATHYGVSTDYLMGIATDPIESRVSADYVKAIKEVSESYLSTVAVMMAVGIGKARDKENLMTALANKSRDLINAIDIFIERNREQFEEEMLGGATIVARQKDIHTLLQRMDEEQRKAAIERNPQEWVKVVPVIKEKLSLVSSQKEAYQYLGTIAQHISKQGTLDF